MIRAEDNVLTLVALNDADQSTFVEMLADTVENAPWVYEALERRRPFASVEALWREIMATLRAAPLPAQIALFRGHPELAGKEAVARQMTPNSTREQDRLGLVSMPAGDIARLRELNSLYRDRFGYPCIVALRHQKDRAGIFEAIAGRLTNDAEAEREIVLAEIGEIVRGRLDRRIAGTMSATEEMVR